MKIHGRDGAWDATPQDMKYHKMETMNGSEPTLSSMLAARPAMDPEASTMVIQVKYGLIIPQIPAHYVMLEEQVQITKIMDIPMV